MEKKRCATWEEDNSDYFPPKKRTNKRMLNRIRDIQCLAAEDKKNEDITRLPEDILIDIFLLIPAEDLHNSVRLVCKSWWNTIQDPYFIDRQLSYSKSIDHEPLKISHSSQVKPQRKTNRGSLNTRSILGKRLRSCEVSPMPQASSISEILGSLTLRDNRLVGC